MKKICYENDSIRFGYSKVSDLKKVENPIESKKFLHILM